MAEGTKRVYTATSAAHGATPTTINSATHFIVNTSSVKQVDPGPAGSPGMADELVSDRRIEVTLFAEDPDELIALVEAAAGNFIGGFLKEAGADGTVTIKNVKFNDPPQLNVAPKDAPGAAQLFSITGRAQWGATDTWALMLVYA